MYLDSHNCLKGVEVGLFISCAGNVGNTRLKVWRCQLFWRGNPVITFVIWKWPILVWSFYRKITQYSPSESAKVYEKTVSRRNNSCFDPKATLQKLRQGSPASVLDENARRALIEQYLDVSAYCFMCCAVCFICDCHFTFCLSHGDFQNQCQVWLGDPVSWQLAT